jgi:retron-type reverse transcriptase
MLTEARRRLRRGAQRRQVGIPAVADKVVRAAMRFVLEPIFETAFDNVSHSLVMERVRARIRRFARKGSAG